MTRPMIAVTTGARQPDWVLIPRRYARRDTGQPITDPGLPGVSWIRPAEITQIDDHGDWARIWLGHGADARDLDTTMDAREVHDLITGVLIEAP